MYTTIRSVHYILMVLNLAIILFTVGKFFLQKRNGAEFGSAQNATTLVATMLAHIQMLVGFILLYVSPLSQHYSNMGGAMKDSAIRMMIVEHPFTMLLGVIAITVGRVRMKKQTTDEKKYGTIITFYLIALLLFVSRIPWSNLHG